MPRSIKKRSVKRGGYYPSAGSGLGAASFGPADSRGGVPQKGGSKRQSRKNRRHTLKRKQKRTLKSRKSFLSTLNQMGGFIRDGSTQFFKLFEEK